MAYDQDLGHFRQGQVDNLSLGQNGMLVETGTTALTGLSLYCIHFITAGSFTTLTNDAGATGDAITGITFPAGFTLYGRFSAVTLASGSIIGYKYADDPA